MLLKGSLVVIMKEFNLSDLEWDFSDCECVPLKVGNCILNITRDELEGFIESWNENCDDE